MTPVPARSSAGDPTGDLDRLLRADPLDDVSALRSPLDAAEEALAARTEPRWAAWRHALSARRAVVDGDADVALPEIAAARAAAEAVEVPEEQGLVLAYLAHVEMTADRVDAALLLAIDASVLIDGPAAPPPSRALLQAHRWLSLAVAGLDLDELAVASAQRACAVASELGNAGDRGRLVLQSAQQHTELARTLLARGACRPAAEPAEAAIGLATAARELDWEPTTDEQHLLDLVQASAMTCSGQLEDALGPLRRVHRRIGALGGVWLRGYAGRGLADLLTRLAARPGQRPGEADRLGEEALDLLVEATGAFAASGDHRRYRQGLLELGRLCAGRGRAAEALHWLEAYRAETGWSSARGRELWADMFVRRSRLREAERSTAVLRRHAMEDPLTGLGNRRSAERRLGTLRQGTEPLSLAVVDVDRFKEVNDGGSHSQGDAVLRRVADLLREHSRAGDEVFRWAGDEFLVVLPTASEAQAVGVMERLRAAVEAASWHELRLPAPVTVSIGVACAPGNDDGGAPLSWRALFDTADLQLLSAKRGGRNRIAAPGDPGLPSGGSLQDGEPEERRA